MFVKERFLDTRFLDSDEPRKDVFGVQKLIQFSTSSKRYHLLYPTAAYAALPPLEWSQIIESMPPRPRCLCGSLYGDGCHFLVRSLGIRPNNPQPLPDCAQTLLQPLPEAVPFVVGDFL